MRRFHREHKDRIIEMIYAIYQEYNDVMYFLGADKDLLDIDNHYIYQNGEFWIETDPEDNNKIIGSIAMQRDLDNRFAVWLKRFYLLPEYRGTGLAKKMHKTAMEWCRLNKLHKVQLWCNSKFARAHSFFKRNGYQQRAVRSINNAAIPYEEYYLVKML